MDLQALFQDSRVVKKTHIVMKSVGKEKGGSLKGWDIPPIKERDGSPAYSIFAVKNRKAMENLGWELVQNVADPIAAISKPKKAVKDVE